MEDDKLIQVETGADREGENTALFISFVVLMALAYGIGWKLSDKSDIGGTIGMGLGFVCTMLIKCYREMIIFLSFIAIIITLFVILIRWITA